jgi:hypothetical protein
MISKDMERMRPPLDYNMISKANINTTMHGLTCCIYIFYNVAFRPGVRRSLTSFLTCANSLNSLRASNIASLSANLVEGSGFVVRRRYYSRYCCSKSMAVFAGASEEGTATSKVTSIWIVS